MFPGGQRGQSPGVPQLDLPTVLDQVGRRLAELRRAHGWTQEQMSERLGVLTSYLQRIEAGRENLTLGSLVALANVLGTSLTDIFRPPATARKIGRPPRRG